MREEVRVVVVDDHQDAAEMLAAALEIEGYEVRSCGDGASALTVIAEFRPQLVLLDVNMPGMDGSELTKRLRELYGDEIVLIAISGYDPGDERVGRTFEQVDHYFRKPVDLVALQKIVNPR